MISKNRIKLIRSLEMKKKRNETGLFVAEGPKLVGDLWAHFDCVYTASTETWLHRCDKEGNNRKTAREHDTVTEEELRKVSLLKHPQEVIALFRIPEEGTLPVDEPAHRLCLALDDVQDPGNMGTILRLADWFGIETVFCSPGCADLYNPKTVQATMGGLAHVKVYYHPLPELLAQLPADVPVYGTFLDGPSLYTQPLSRQGVIVMGNEGRGISREVEQAVSHRLHIPNYPPARETTESLNVAVATAIICAEFRRRVL
ncbi:MAG: RNA methyltransferase [Paraprevotella sp.]|nr:RNA methyltransferase [Paraprevotella sp.]